LKIESKGAVEMEKGFFGRTGFVATGDFCDFCDLDKMSGRVFLEDLGLWRSYACMEVMEARKGVVFLFEKHFKRLSQSMTKLKLPVPPRMGGILAGLQVSLKAVIQGVMERNELESALIYVLVSAGPSADLFRPAGSANMFILARPFSFPRLQHGLKLMTMVCEREFPEIKTTNYLAAELASGLVWATGYDDILCAPRGLLLESSRANFFMVKTIARRPVITTSFLEDEYGVPYVLPGVTRELVLDLAKKEGYLTAESLLKTRDLRAAEEVFLASTGLGVWPVTKIDRRSFPVGPVSLTLRKAFLKYRRDYYRRAGVDKK
jgi:D-alanine transaminase